MNLSLSSLLPDSSLPWPFLFIITGVFGAIIGSFLNVVIHRLPIDESIVFPNSRCPSCNAAIASYDNIPILSYLALAARCRHCRAPIARRYPLVELLTGIAVAAVFLRFHMGPLGMIYAAFVCALIAASFIDLDFQIIPDEISLGGLALGLLVSAAVPSLHGTDSRWLAFGRSVVGMLVGGGLLYLTGLMGDIVFRKESMGGGDVKLLAMAGAILGWKATVVTFFLAPLLALIPGLLVLFFKRSHLIPYGPFLSLGLILSLFTGRRLVDE